MVLAIANRSSLERRLVCPIGFEPMTYGLEIRCSIQLSYGHINAIFRKIFKERI